MGRSYEPLVDLIASHNASSFEKIAENNKLFTSKNVHMLLIENVSKLCAKYFVLVAPRKSLQRATAESIFLRY